MKRQSEIQKIAGVKIGRRITATVEGVETVGRVTATRLNELEGVGIWGTVVFKTNGVNEYREVMWSDFKIVA